MSYSVYLPNYSIGENCYKELPYVARNYGKKAVVIGGKTAMEKTKDALLEGIKGSDLEITDFIWYGGDSSYENGNALIANPAVRNADIIFGVGGGRACDTAKYVANELDKPLFTFPDRCQQLRGRDCHLCHLQCQRHLPGILLSEACGSYLHQYRRDCGFSL